MNYNLDFNKVGDSKMLAPEMFRKLWQLVGEEKRKLLVALLVILVNSLLSLVAPFLIGDAVDKFVQTNEYPGVIRYAVVLLVLFLIVLLTGYIQTQLMGKVGQRMLYNLRDAVFQKLQELPFTFFNQNKAGDLISRINSDTEKINQFFSNSLIQFAGSLVSMTGAAVFLLTLNFKLGLAALIPGLVLWVFTRSVSSYVKKKNAVSLHSAGQLSAEIQENLANFKVIVAFNRRDFFRTKFETANEDNYRKALRAGMVSNSLAPVYGLLAAVGQLVVLSFGIYLILNGEFSVGLLISFLSYIVLFYNPLRQIAGLWANFQMALACWDRISMILSLGNDMQGEVPMQSADIASQHASSIKKAEVPVMTFENVSFAYVPGNDILTNVSFELQKGRTYAFVGPTGGGKTTTASLMARLFDPSSGLVTLHGSDLRTFSNEERTRRIGFILQDPVLFSGSLRTNIVYGNPIYQDMDNDALLLVLQTRGLTALLSRFADGLDMEVSASGDGVSWGQRQLIAFMRAVLRDPDLLILDEATANIDTLTELMLSEVLAKLPKTTTKIIIAHRLNTIENADEIFFVNGGTLLRAGSMQQAVELLMHGKRIS